MALVSLSGSVLLVLSLWLLGLIVVSFQRRHIPLPPGPYPKPLIGNLFDLPSQDTQEWKHWLKHKDLYGPLSSVTIFGQTIIIINDAHLAVELLEKRSVTHSSRPRMVFAGEMVGWEHALSSQNNSKRFRAYRKVIGRVLGSLSDLAKFDTLQEIEVGRYLWRLLQDPDNLAQHIRTEAGAIILKIAYGYQIEPHRRDPLVDIADTALEQFSKAAIPGVWLVDVIPALKYLPSWFPGTGFKRTALLWRKHLSDLVEKPYFFTTYQLDNGQHNVSFLSALLKKGNLNPEDEHVAKWSAASLYSGGADTSVSSLNCYYLALSLYPDVQRKAQDEIDRVIGTNRLPTFSDRQNLPYVDAIVKEVLRWHPVAPMGLPHMADEEDTCEGYCIPKGALLLANIWAFTHDPNIYHEPEKFRPERFIANDDHEIEPDPHTLSFGFGRRICPGRYLADSTLYLTIAQSLAVFNIKKLCADDGHEIEPSVYFQPGIISHPVSNKWSIKPRSPQHEALIRSVEENHPWEGGDSETLEKMA